MRSVLSRTLLVVAFVLAASGSGAYYGWTWSPLEGPTWLSVNDDDGKYLTENQGAHAVAIQGYGNGLHRLLVTATLDDQETDRIKVYEYEDFWDAEGQEVIPHYDGEDDYNTSACIAAGTDRKHVAAVEDDGDEKCWWAAQDLDVRQSDWPYFKFLTVHGSTTTSPDVTVATQVSGNDHWVYVVHQDEDDDDVLYCSLSADDGENWYPVDVPVQSTVRLAYEPSLGVNGSSTVYVAFSDPINQDIYFNSSTSNGANWSANATNLTLNTDGVHPCLASYGDRVFVCWIDPVTKNVKYRWSSDGGSSWHPALNQGPGDVWEWEAGSSVYDQVNAVMIPNQGPGQTPRRTVLLSARVRRIGVTNDLTAVVWKSITIQNSLTTYPELQISPCSFVGDDPDYCPSIYAVSDDDDTLAALVWSDRAGSTTGERQVWVAKARYRYSSLVSRGPAGPTTNTGRRLAVGPDGTPLYAAHRLSYVISGPTWGSCIVPIFADCGFQPALAVDGDAARWLAYVRDDTIWCRLGENGYKAVFAGSSSAVPGQPSIVCYPEAATAGYVGSVVFPVYDTVGGSSIIMYARIDTSQVVLDTIESVANLRDSLPCISIYKTDTLLATFQHGDSVLSVMLADYGPGTTGRPGAWSSPNLVTAHGYHAMNAFEQGGSVLNCVWTGKDGDNYAIKRATNDLSGGMFPSWTAQADPSASATSEVGNSVYAGLGVTCWQAKVNGKWVIKGNVRGEETTLVANDTDAYHPQAVAESSAISPSIDQVRVHILWTEGVTFEVDSAVYDTGETRYKCESLSVSHAGSDATKYNQGAKFLRKALSDSLFCTYADLDGAVMYAYSATGDTWQRDVMLTDRTWPAIAEDSSGKRWVVVHKSNVGGTQAQEAYYRNGSSWTGPQTLYTGQQNGTVGPAGLAGSSYTTSGIAYAAFLASIGGGYKSVVLAKFNGSTVATYTVATGLYLGDPTLAVEPYKTDSDHVHLSWADNGVVKYCMDTDGRSSTIASRWTSTVTLSNAMVTAGHPCIAADRDQIAVAWAQGATTEIYSRKRSTGSAYNNWESELNLSNTNTASDYPTIAMGDTVIVAWEEHRTGSDYDVLVCINFGDTVNIADNATKSGYPHVLFQNKTSGDTCIPYLLSVWSEAPEANVYEVAYNKLNLKQSGEGQQSAGKVTIPMKPALNACRPNPFRDRTQISYQLPSAGNVSLRVYDATGRTVRTLQNGFQKPGAYSVSWDSKDSRGRLVPHGVYFYRLDTPGFRDVKKAVVTR